MYMEQCPNHKSIVVIVIFGIAKTRTTNAIELHLFRCTMVRRLMTFSQYCYFLNKQATKKPTFSNVHELFV